MSDVLTIKNLKKSFGGLKVIDGLDLTVEEGAVFGFVGQNGAGKTTTMKMILGLLQTDGGEITVCGEKVRYGETVNSIGYLPDVPEFYGYMRPMEYLRLCGEIAGMTKAGIKERGKKLLKLVGLSKAKRKISGFSRGMKQRLGVAQALLNEPKLLICDEPTSALDPVGRKELLDILLSLKGQTTVIFSTHILSDVERICDRVAFLRDGKVAVSGALSEIRKRRADEYNVEFETADEADKFMKCGVKAKFKKPDGSETAVTVSGTDGGALISALAKHKLTPLRFEILEPSLESLFMEIVK